MEIDFISSLHKSTKRDYLSRVNDKEYPKYLAAKLAKKWGYHYWDGSRKINYGGYKYIPRRWKPVAEKFLLLQDQYLIFLGITKSSFLNIHAIVLYPESTV